MEYIYEIKNSIPDTLCKDIITMYELENIRYPGVTLSGVNQNIKKTTDMVIPKNDLKWCKIEKILYDELKKSLIQYNTFISNKLFNMNNNFDNNIDSIHFETQKLHTESFMIQKYDMQDGKYIYHNDFLAERDKYRVITFLWYLNDVNIGGETEFWGGKFYVKPEIGKLILFPSSWTYPHRGKMPISSDKYIITGWIYSFNESI